jgi:hypothetical protein
MRENIGLAYREVRMNLQKLLKLYVVISLIWVSVWTAMSLYYITSPLSVMLVGLLLISFFATGINIARRSPALPLPKYWFLAFAFLIGFGIIEMLIWVAEGNRMRPSELAWVYLISGSGLILITVITLIVICIIKYYHHNLWK